MATFTSQAASANTFIRVTAATTNYSGLDQIQVGEANDDPSGQVNRSLIKWDLSSIPATATVSSATLSLWLRSDYSDNARTWRVFRVKRNWVEAEATWNVYSSGNSWGTAGCSNTTTDREASDIGSVSVGASETVTVQKDFSLTASAVQEWIAGTTANYGLLIQADTEVNDLYVVNSNSFATSGERPKLVINYTIGGGEFLAFFT